MSHVIKKSCNFKGHAPSSGDPLMASYPHQVLVPPKKGIHGAVVVVVVVVVVYASVPAADILAK